MAGLGCWLNGRCGSRNFAMDIVDQTKKVLSGRVDIIGRRWIGETALTKRIGSQQRLWCVVFSGGGNKKGRGRIEDARLDPQCFPRPQFPVYKRLSASNAAQRA